MTDYFTRAIETGSPLHLSAATFYVGLAQWQYGDFVKNVELPSDLTDDERAQATAGSEGQATQYYDAAKKTWQALLDKAEKEKIDNEWVTRAREAVAGTVPTTPPPRRQETIEIRGQVPTPQVVTVRPREAPAYSRRVLVPAFLDRDFWPSILPPLHIVTPTAPLRTDSVSSAPADSAARPPASPTRPATGIRPAPPR
jgi:hypothetical protein